MDPNTQTIFAPETKLDQANSPTNFSFKTLSSKKRKMLIIFGIIFVLVSLAFIIGAIISSNSDKKVRLVIENANNSYIAGDISKARQDLESAYGEYPDNEDVQAALIKVIANQGNLSGDEKQKYDEAKKYIEDALKDNPNNVQVLLSVGYIEEVAGNYPKALEYYDKALSMDSNNPEGWFHRGHVLYFQGDYVGGRTAIEKSYSLDNKDPLVLIAMGNIAYGESDLEKAYRYFLEASKISDTPVQIRSEALTAASITRRLQLIYMDESIALAKQAVDLNPTFSPALGAYGYVLSINGRAAEGAEYLTKAIESNPRISLNYHLGAMVLRMVGQYTDSVDYEKQAIEKVANDNTILGASAKAEVRSNYLYELAVTHTLNGGNTETVALLSEALSLNPMLKDNLVTDYETNGRFAELSSNLEFQALLL